jgi:serine/threonine-protein kinase HipA
MFGWLIAARDHRPDDIAMLIGAGGRARLAPIHAMASTLPQAGEASGGAPWARFAGVVRLPVGQIVAACRDMALAIPAALRSAAAQMRADGVDHPALAPLVAQLTARAERCALDLAA